MTSDYWTAVVSPDMESGGALTDPTDRPVAVITGAARGLGRATALRFARAGYDVVVTARSARASAHPSLPGTVEDVVEELEQLGAAALAVPADLAEARSVEEIHRATADRFGRCDVLVNNAAYSPIRPLLELSPSKWHAALTVNVWAPAALARLFLPEMLERGSGAVINVGSVASVAPVPQAAPYCVSKAALERLTEVIEDEIGGRGVLAVCVRIEERIPSETDALMQSLGVGATSEPGQTTPEHYARAIEWLTSQPTLSGRTVTLSALREMGAMGDL